MKENRFYEITPTTENYWRAIILFGRNTASYKFALAKALYDLQERKTDLVKLDELAPHFVKHILEHLKNCDKQGTQPKSLFLDACRRFNANQLGETEMLDITVQRGFNHVIDAFHNVHNTAIEKRFFIDERKQNNGIRLTDQFYQLAGSSEFQNLINETEARWRLVETAWELNLSRHIIQIQHDLKTNIFHTFDHKKRRVNITPSRYALNGYQKGRCFYCFRPISIYTKADNLADVDHFFPHKLYYCAGKKPIDGVANLVLACKDCNRGENGKSDRVPSLNLLERLYTRNEYLINSHHPLRETLILQTGLTSEKRKDLLQQVYNCSKTHLISTWEPHRCGDPVF